MTTAGDSEPLAELAAIKVLLFDVIGTTTDWLSPVVAALVAGPIRVDDPVEFARAWRSAFGTLIRTPGQGELIDTYDAYRRSLDILLEKHGIKTASDNDGARRELVRSWGRMQAWEDTARGLELLRSKHVVAALSNGRASMMIDINKKNGMVFDLLLTSDIVQAYKPSPKMYQAALSALNVKPDEIAMVAAHAYDLRAARQHGFKTIYIERETETVLESEEERNSAKTEFDLYVKGGLIELARSLGIKDDVVTEWD